MASTSHDLATVDLGRTVLGQTLRHGAHGAG